MDADMTPPDDHDPLGYRADLLALFDGGIDAADPAVAGELFHYLGACRLHGVALPAGVTRRLAAGLAAAAFAAAVAGLERLVRRAIARAATLPARFDASTDDLEGISYCTEMIHWRNEFWATGVAVAEHCLDPAGGVEAAAARSRHYAATVAAAVAEFDAILRGDEYMGLLGVALATNLLDNSRALLAEPFRSAPPWWLDGSIEAASARVDAAIAGD